MHRAGIFAGCRWRRLDRLRRGLAGLRSKVFRQILRWFRAEFRGATLAAEVISPALVCLRGGRGIGLYVHPANRIFKCDFVRCSLPDLNQARGIGLNRSRGEVLCWIGANLRRAALAAEIICLPRPGFAGGGGVGLHVHPADWISHRLPAPWRYFALSGSFSPGRIKVGAFFLGGAVFFSSALRSFTSAGVIVARRSSFSLASFAATDAARPGRSAWFSSRLS